MAALPPERFDQARWFGGKSHPSAASLVDAVELSDGRGLVVVELAGEAYLLPALLETLEDVPASDRLWLELAEIVRDGRTVGPLQGVPTVHAALLDAAGAPRALGADQSHTSIVLGERCVLKCYRRLGGGPNAEVELATYLSSSGMRRIPAVAGSLRFGARDVALCQAYFGGTLDGWEGAKRDLASDTQRVGEWAAGIGSALAELHALLIARDGRPATRAESEGWADAASAQLDRALSFAPHDVSWAEAILRAQVEVLRRQGGAIVSRVHGDFHLAQVLIRDGTVVAIVDLEGEPGRAAGEGRALGTPLRDVAGMLRSFNHVARFVGWKLGTPPPPEIEAWIAMARGAFLGAYLEHHEVDRALLFALECEKATYEFVYAAQYLPYWTEVAARSLRALLARVTEQ